MQATGGSSGRSSKERHQVLWSTSHHYSTLRTTLFSHHSHPGLFLVEANSSFNRHKILASSKSDAVYVLVAVGNGMGRVECMLVDSGCRDEAGYDRHHSHSLNRPSAWTRRQKEGRKTYPGPSCNSLSRDIDTFAECRRVGVCGRQTEADRGRRPCVLG
jgi:hypothetical protein